MRRAGLALLTIALAALAVAGLAHAAEETWHDDASSDQGVEFTRDITRTHVPRFYDMRPAAFSCSDGTGYQDPLVVVSAGDGSGDLPVTIASDGSFSYDGPALYNPGTAHISFQGRFDADKATGTMHWTASRPAASGSCQADSGTVAWSAHCVSSCGGVSSGGLTVTMSGKPVIGQWALVDVHVSSDGAARIVAFAHHGSARACGTFSEENAVAAQKLRHGPVERLGEAQVPGPGAYVFHGKYIPDQFGHRDRICAYLTEAPEGDTVLASGEGTPKIGFALPWNGGWGPVSNRSTLGSGIYGFHTPDTQRPRGTAPGFFIIGTWGCDGGLQRSTTLGGRRWWLGASSFEKALRLTPVRPRADGSFAFNGPAHPDFSRNYDHPIPKLWPSHSMRIALSGHFTAGHDPDGQGVVTGGRAKLTVVNGSHRCKTSFKIPGGGAESDLPAKTDRRYGGTLTAG